MAEHPVSEPEEWRPVPGHPGYEASSLGRVRSLDRWVGSANGAQTWKHFYAGRVLRPTPYRKYHQVYLGQDGGYTLTSIVVCAAFHGARPSDRHQAAHWNGDKHDNRAVNLRWATPKQNKADDVRNGAQICGITHYMAKLTEADVRAIRQLRMTTGLTLEAIGSQFGITKEHTWRVVRGISWKHVP